MQTVQAWPVHDASRTAKTKQNSQYLQFKCASYFQAVQLFDLNALLELDDIEDNVGLPFPKQQVNSLWSKSSDH